MSRLLATLALAVTVATLLVATPAPARRAAAAKKEAEGLRIIKGPDLESATDRSAIIRWTTNTAWRGQVLQFGVVRYGTDPEHLDLMAKSPNRWNKNLPDMLYRVRVDGLKPGTTYQYAVDSALGNGSRAGLKSPVRQFTTPGAGQRVVNYVDGEAKSTVRSSPPRSGGTD